jgi:hypothetical protein
VFDIAEELSLTVGGTSKLVDRIEAAGHCVRRANPDDRRSSIIELTPRRAAGTRCGPGSVRGGDTDADRGGGAGPLARAVLRDPRRAAREQGQPPLDLSREIGTTSGTCRVK